MVLDQDIQLNMDGRGRATDNIAIERFWRSLKYEDIYLYSYDSTMALRAGISHYMTFYNQKRKHQGLNNKTPEQVYKQTEKTTQNLTNATAFPHKIFYTAGKL